MFARCLLDRVNTLLLTDCDCVRQLVFITAVQQCPAEEQCVQSCDGTTSLFCFVLWIINPLFGLVAYILAGACLVQSSEGLNGIALYGKPISELPELRSVTCHMGSHSVTRHR